MRMVPEGESIILHAIQLQSDRGVKFDALGLNHGGGGTLFLPYNIDF